MADATLDMEINVLCPQCGKTSMKRLRELVGNDTTICNRGGHVIDISGKEWKATIAKAFELVKKVEPPSSG